MNIHTHSDISKAENKKHIPVCYLVINALIHLKAQVPPPEHTGQDQRYSCTDQVKYNISAMQWPKQAVRMALRTQRCPPVHVESSSPAPSLPAFLSGLTAPCFCWLHHLYPHTNYQSCLSTNWQTALPVCLIKKPQPEQYWFCGLPKVFHLRRSLHFIP